LTAGTGDEAGGTQDDVEPGSDDFDDPREPQEAPLLRAITGGTSDAGDRDTLYALCALDDWCQTNKRRSRTKTQSWGSKTPERMDKAIDRLGSRLGLRLREKSGRSWVLTPDGQRLAQQAHRILAAFNEVVYEIYEGKGTEPTLRPELHVGCFNAQVKLFVAEALGPLAADESFGYGIRFNRDMNVRTVNARILMDNLGRGHRPGGARDEAGGRRTEVDVVDEHDHADGQVDDVPGPRAHTTLSLPSRRFDYAIVPWISGRAPYGRYGPQHYVHRRLYSWQLLVVTREPVWESPVELGEVLGHCEHEGLPLLLTPSQTVSRIMFDYEILRSYPRVPLASSILENPDSYTRYELAHHGHGVAIVPADTMPASDQHYPALAGRGKVLTGFHTLSWQASRRRTPRAVPSENPYGIDDAVQADKAFAPAGVNQLDHDRFCTAIHRCVKEFVKSRDGLAPLEWSDR